MFLLPWKFEFDTQSGHQSVVAVRVLAKGQGLPLRANGLAGSLYLTKIVQGFQKWTQKVDGANWPARQPRPQADSLWLSDGSHPNRDIFIY
jgi:hypothetical protein